MKKYVKPTVVIERFELNHSVANCSPAMNHQRNTCKYESDELYGLIGSGETVFGGDCTYNFDEFVGRLEDFCMQTSAPGQTLFTS